MFFTIDEAGPSSTGIIKKQGGEIIILFNNAGIYRGEE
jgi:hypothetical protein